MTHQHVNLRTRGSIHPSPEAQREHEAKLAEFRRAIPPSTQFVVGPGSSIITREGVSRGPGDAISRGEIPDEAGAPEKGRVGWQVFEQHLWHGRIIENYGYRPLTSK